MRAFGVSVDKAGIEIGLQVLDAVVEVPVQLHTVELVEHGAVEIEVELVGMLLGAADIAAIAGEDRADWQVSFRESGRPAGCHGGHRFTSRL